jgi:diaminopimelate epimerase
MKKIPFIKMAGAGNDFLVVENDPKMDYQKLAPKMCARQNGVGADGILVLDKSKSADYKMRIINADGTEAEMCGNGARCMAAYIVAKSAPKKKLFGMETIAGTILAEAEGDIARVRLSDPKDYRPGVPLTIAGNKMQVDYIDTGVPHVVVFVEKLQEIDVNKLGALIRNHGQFKPRGTNVNFVEHIREGHVAVRTFERGVEGETLACGTGSVASALISYIHANPKIEERVDASMKVLTKSSELLEVSFDLLKGKKITNVWLKGSARFIASGEYYLEA